MIEVCHYTWHVIRHLIVVFAQDPPPKKNLTWFNLSPY